MGHTKTHKEEEQIHPYQQYNDAERGSEDLGTNNSLTRGRYLGEPRKKNYERMWLGNFQPGRKESAYLGKMTKGKEAKRWV